MQKQSKPDSLKDQDPKSKISKINFASWIRGFCRHSSHPFFGRIRIRKLNLDLIPRSCKYAVNQLVWRIRIPRLNLNLVPKSCKDVVNQVAWRIRFPKLNLDFPKIMQKQSKPGSLEDQDPKSKISKINFASWIRGFCRHLYTFVILFLKHQDPKIESSFSPKIMQIRCKPAGLEDPDPKIESRFSPKIMQINYKQG